MKSTDPKAKKNISTSVSLYEGKKKTAAKKPLKDTTTAKIITPEMKFGNEFFKQVETKKLNNSKTL